jgi:hypothetical protein
MPQTQLKSALANQTLRELGPLLAEEGIDIDNVDVPNLHNMQAAIKRAVERHDMTRLTALS